LAKVLVMYYSKTGNTGKVAEAFADGLKREKVEVTVKKVEDTKVNDLLAYDGIAIGSPTYYGQMAGKIKEFLDESIKVHDKLNGKVGAAFTSSGGYGSGGETTVLSILNAMLVHGMIVQGDSKSKHYGAIVEQAPSEEDRSMVVEKGRQMGQLVKKLFPR